MLTETSPGAFISCCKERAPAKMITDNEGQRMQEKFWAEAMELYRSLASDRDLGLE